MVWDPDQGTHFAVVPRYGSPEDVRWFDMDARFMFHMMNAYEDGGKLVMDVTASNATLFGPKPDGTMADESDGLNPNLRRWERWGRHSLSRCREKAGRFKIRTLASERQTPFRRMDKAILPPRKNMSHFRC